MEKASIWFDKELWRAVEDIMVGGGPFFGDLQWTVASLHIRVMGLGLYSVIEATSYMFVASRDQSCVLHDHILRYSRIYGMYLDIDKVFDGHSVAVSDFDLSRFTKRIVSLIKHNMFWKMSFLVKVFKTWM